jgi:dihydrofolate reductase
MGKLIISENVTLDGVVEDPRGDEGRGRGDWFDWITERDRDEWGAALVAETLAADALLLGRGSYDFFATRYPTRTDALADRVNSMPKYVVSSTLDQPAWSNTTVLAGEVVNEVSKLKHELDGDLVVYASTQLVGALVEHDLADELRVMVYPIVLGAGNRLFGATRDPKPMRLVGSRTVGDNLVFLTYQPRRSAHDGRPPRQP